MIVLGKRASLAIKLSFVAPGALISKIINPGLTFSGNQGRAVGRKNGGKSSPVLERVRSETNDEFSFLGREDGVGPLGSGEAAVGVEGLSAFSVENLNKNVENDSQTGGQWFSDTSP